jgi:hypothetical protein
MRKMKKKDSMTPQKVNNSIILDSNNNEVHKIPENSKE